MARPEEQIRNCLISVESHFFRRFSGRIRKPGSFRKIATLLVEKTENEIREGRDPWFDEN